MFSVLLVEDERLELETLRDYVDWEKSGVGKVYTARNGRMALEYMNKYEPDILVTDIQMPEMSGIELTRRVRELGFQSKIVFLTGYDEFAYVKSAFMVGAIDYILKPFIVEEVEGLVSRICSSIRKERIDAESLKIAAGKFLEKACAGSMENEEELAATYFGCELTEKEFGMLAIYGEPKQEGLIRMGTLPEVRHFFEAENMVCVILNSRIAFSDAAERALQRIEGNGSIVWIKENLSIKELASAFIKLSSLKDIMFHHREGEVIGSHELFCWNVEMVDSEKLYEEKKVLRKAIITGNEDIARNSLKKCFTLFTKCSRQECKREALGIYMNLCNCLEREDELLAKDMEKRKEKPELEIYQAQFFYDLERKIWQYVRALMDFYRRKRENPNYYVTAWVKNYLEENYGGICSVEDMAENLNLSPNYLRSVFKSVTNQTILEYVTELRLQKASFLLKDKTLKVKDVAMAVGYESVSYFSHIFLKRFEVTPNEYRKMV